MARKSGWLLALGGVISTTVVAQQPARPNSNQKPMTTQTEDFRRTAPAPLAARPLNLPAPTETVLSNGLRVVMLEDKRLPLVNFRLAFRTGAAFDPREIPGLTDITANLLTEGTTTRISQQISDEVARIGGTLSADVSSDAVVIAASSLNTFSKQLLDLMADVVLRPSFPENEVALAKQNTKQSLALQRSQAAFLANERISKVLYGDNPYSVVTTTPEAVDRMTREVITNHYRRVFVPDNAVLVVVGDFNSSEMKTELESYFGEAKWKRGQALNAEFPTLPVRTARAIYVVDRPGSAQSNIVIGNAALKRNDPDYFPVLVMHTVLGANASSRLFMNLREDKGYTYGAYSNLDTRREAGTFRTSAEVRTPVTGAALKEFFYELERIRTTPVSDKELADAKSYLSGVFPIRLETQEGIVSQLVQIKLYGLPANYLQTYRDAINRVTKQDVQRVAQKYLTPDKAAIVVVGDYNQIATQIKPYAQAIELYDANGNRQEMTTMQTSSTTPNTDIFGTWKLTVNSPQGALPATLTLTNTNGAIQGSIQVPQLPTIQLTNARITGNALTADATIDFQGQQLPATFNGRVENNQMNGGILISIPGAPPFSFTGTRAN